MRDPRRLRVAISALRISLSRIHLVFSKASLRSSNSAPAQLKKTLQKAYCSRAESDATSIQAAIASYFSEPNNTHIGTTSLNASADRPSLNPSNTFTLEDSIPAGSAYKVVVSDGSGRCPRSTTAKQYVTYFGTSAESGWRP